MPYHNTTRPPDVREMAPSALQGGRKRTRRARVLSSQDEQVDYIAVYWS